MLLPLIIGLALIPVFHYFLMKLMLIVFSVNSKDFNYLKKKYKVKESDVK